MEASEDWRVILQTLNDRVKLIVKLPEVVTLPLTKDYVDIKIQYRRLKIEEQCRKLNPKINIEPVFMEGQNEWKCGSHKY